VRRATRRATPRSSTGCWPRSASTRFCAQALALPEERWPSLARLLVNASITKVISGHTGTSLVTFNDHAHLETDRALITYR